MGRPHLLVIPFPVQGHVLPLMEFSPNMVDHGFKIPFINTEFNHKRVVSAQSDEETSDGSFSLVSLPDGMEPEEDRNKMGRLNDAMAKAMPGYLEELITKINGSNEEDKITCVIADFSMVWALEIAAKLSIAGAGFLTASGQLLAEILHIPQLIEDGVFAADGTLMKSEMIQISPTMPATNPAQYCWLSMGESTEQKSIFNLMLTYSRVLQLARYCLCNSFYELEPSAFAMIPNLLPIGPLNASRHQARFWSEDLTCLSWLDQQTPKSVIYVAFGSFARMEKRQFDELALGLELLGHPFLWVVRQDQTSEKLYPEGFEARVRSRGRMVGWAPQREVLAHPSIACFMTHCGWNSTMEGISHGVPLLCWPYFADQFLNRTYICDIWKVGLGFAAAGENGVISREECKKITVWSFLGPHVFLP